VTNTPKVKSSPEGVNSYAETSLCPFERIHQQKTLQGVFDNAMEFKGFASLREKGKMVENPHQEVPLQDPNFQSDQGGPQKRVSWGGAILNQTGSLAFTVVGMPGRSEGRQEGPEPTSKDRNFY